MWSRIRHRRLQALSLLSLAALLTTSLCLGPLYQRAMEQALAGSALANASPEQRALRLSSDDLSVTELEHELPAGLAAYVRSPVSGAWVDASVPLPDGQSSVVTRLYTATGACDHLEVVEGDCPTGTGQVMVSSDDVAVNGWSVGDRVPVTERVDVLFEGDNPPEGEVTVVGVYRPPAATDGWLGAPITGRAGQNLQDVGVATDDWVTASDTVLGSSVGQWYRTTGSVAWELDTVDHDDLLRIGPAIDAYRQGEVENPGSSTVRIETDLPGLARSVASGSDQGRTTVVVLVVQLLVLVAVVLWMVLVAATDERRPELALARLRGRGRRGAAAYLLSELLPVTLLGVAAGVLLAPFVMDAVARLVFPVPVPRELPGGFVVAALGAAGFVLLVVLAAARRAVREPVDALLRAVPARHTGTGAGVAEVTLVVFSLTAVVALVTGNLEGPLATLAPTLLAVAVGLLLARGLGPVTRLASRRLLRGGRAVAAAGIVNAVRRPSARRILVMVTVATALLIFCVDALVTGQHNRQNAAEQANGAPYVLAVQPASLFDAVAAVAEADPDAEHVSVVVSMSGAGLGSEGPTVAVDPTAFPRIAYFPLSRPSPADWAAIQAPSADPVRLTGETLAGTMDVATMDMRGPSRRYEDVRAVLQVQPTGAETVQVPIAVVPKTGGSVPISAELPCAQGCAVTGLTVATPPGLELMGTLVFRDLTLDDAAVSLGRSEDYRRVVGDDGSLSPAEDAAGNVGATVSTSGSEPPVMYATWVPDPVPALVTTAEDPQFTGPGLDDQIDLTVAGRVDRVPGSPPGSRLVDVNGLLRRPGVAVTSDVVTVWAEDAGALGRARVALEEHGVLVNDETTVGDVRAELDASPAAWSLALSVLVGGAAVLVAMLVIVVATATTWRARANDLAALRMAGLPARALRRLELLGQLPVVLAGALAGAACGVVAAELALPGVRQFTDPPAVDTTDFSTPWAAVVVASLVAVALLTGLAVATSRWTASRAPLNRIREVV